MIVIVGGGLAPDPGDVFVCCCGAGVGVAFGVVLAGGGVAGRAGAGRTSGAGAGLGRGATRRAGGGAGRAAGTTGAGTTRAGAAAGSGIRPACTSAGTARADGRDAAAAARAVPSSRLDRPTAKAAPNPRSATMAAMAVERIPVTASRSPRAPGPAGRSDRSARGAEGVVRAVVVRSAAGAGGRRQLVVRAGRLAEPGRQAGDRDAVDDAVGEVVEHARGVPVSVGEPRRRSAGSPRP